MGDLRVRVLGPFEVEGVPAGSIGSRKTRRFLKLLALDAGRPVSIDRAVDAIWGDGPPAKPTDQLSVLASRVRAALGTDRVVRTDAGYALRVDWVDRVELDELADDAAARLQAGSVAAAGSAARAALHLVRGPLLADEPDADWADADRLAVEQVVRRVLAIAAEATLAGGDPVAAAALAERGLAGDPYDERALRLLMNAHWQAGRPASALAAYARVREQLRDDLGVSPAAETEALHDEIVLLDADTPTDRPERASFPAGRPAGPAALRQGRAAAPALVGRDAELAALDASRAVAARGHTRVVVVDGQAGIGKSALLDAWCETLPPDMPLLRGWCDELGRQLPLQAVGDALSSFLRSIEAARATELLGPDAAVLRPVVGLPAMAMPTATATATGEPSSSTEAASRSAARTIEGASDQTVLFTALLDVFARIAAASGAVLVLDDVQHADDSTLAWVRFVQRRDAAGALLIVAAARAGAGALPDADDRIALDVLSRDAAAQLVAARAPASAEVLDHLLERSGGHPLFLVELAGAPPGDLPPSIRASVASRLGAMATGSATIEAAAALGATVDLDLLAAVLRRPPLDVLGELEEAARCGVLEERGAGFVFTHDLVRDALAAGVSASRRALLHREAAWHLAEHRRSGADPLRIANHARLGDEPELASTALTDAARNAASRYDYAEAQRLLDEAIALADRAEVRHERGVVRLALGRYAEAAHDAGVALTLGGGAAALELAGWAAYYQRDFRAARRFAEEGARRADDPAIEAGCLLVVGRVHHSDGELDAADQCLTAAVAQAAGALPVGPVWLASLRVHQGRSDDALDLVQPILLAPSTDHPFAVIHAHLTAGYAHAVVGRAAAALGAFDDAADAMRRQGLEARFAGRVQNWHGWVLRYLGATEEADASNEAGVEAATAGNLPEPHAHALLDLADAALQRGDGDAALAMLDRARPFHEGAHAYRWRHALRARLLDARLALLTGDEQQVRAHAAWVRADAAERHVERYAVFADLVDALAAMQARRPGTAAVDAIDPAHVDRLLERLPVLAGLESWWWTHAVAETSRVDRWRALADERAAALIAQAGDHAGTTRRWVSR